MRERENVKVLRCCGRRRALSVPGDGDACRILATMDGQAGNCERQEAHNVLINVIFVPHISLMLFVRCGACWSPSSACQWLTLIHGYTGRELSPLYTL